MRKDEELGILQQQQLHEEAAALPCSFGQEGQGLINYFPSLSYEESENNLGWK